MTSAGSASPPPATSTAAARRRREHLRRGVHGRRDERVDLFLLAGDLTTHGEPEQAAIVADAFRDAGGPRAAVLGNHDLHVNRPDEFGAELEEGGMICSTSTTITASSTIGGARSAWSDQGLRRRLPGLAHPRLRRAQPARDLPRAMEEAAAVETGCRPSPPARCGSSSCTTAEHARRSRASAARSGRLLGTDRLAAPVVEHNPELSCTAMRTRGPSAGASAACRSSTSPCPCWARTSGSSS